MQRKQERSLCYAVFSVKLQLGLQLRRRTAKACIQSILNPPPPFESEDDEVDHDAHDYRDKSVDLVPRMNVTEYTPPNTDQTLPVPTVVKAIMAEDIRGQQNPRALTFLAELDEELRNKNKS